MPNFLVRSFRPCDRQAVRGICCDTADKGAPIEGFFHDRECAADLMTGYYTDYEPSSAFVAEHEGTVVGYALGCLDNRRYGLVMFWILVPRTLLKGLVRGTLFRREVWRLAAGAARNWRRMFVWRKQSFHSHQGHMHIGIAAGFRGRHVGRDLVKALLAHAVAQGIEELTASVHDGNIPACRFFEHLGFEARERYPMIVAQQGRLEHYHSVLYVKKII